MRNLSLCLAALSLSFLALTACKSSPPVELRSGLEVEDSLDRLRPSDIAVLPIEDRTVDSLFSKYARAMRMRLTESLVGRLYSPLAPDHVDRVLADSPDAGTGSPVDSDWVATLAGRFDEDAVLGVRVSRWDPSDVDRTDQVSFSVEVLMIASESGERLWWGRAEGKVKAGGTGPAPVGHEAKIESAVAVLADALAEKLPVRRMGTN